MSRRPTAPRRELRPQVRLLRLPPTGEIQAPAFGEGASMRVLRAAVIIVGLGLALGACRPSASSVDDRRIVEADQHPGDWVRGLKRCSS